ncbi:MAG TPA: hypothetical protein VHT52_10485 [Stellaceae bacterium]|jgi:hypothetical protein|nr:hypothetical protein [Stellaceae bacterium]
MRKILISALALAIATPAVAGCPYGQILRVSMGKCVSWHSKLAHGYMHTMAKQPARRAPRVKIIFAALPAAPIERPEIEVLRERLSRPAPLTAADILLSRAAALVQ